MSLLNKFWTILGHTYMVRVKSKTFIISTLFTILLMIGIANIQTIIGFFSSDDTKRIALIDESEQFGEVFKVNLAEVQENLEIIDYKKSEEEGKQEVQEGNFAALIILSADEKDWPKGSYYAETISEFGLHHQIEQQLQQMKVSIATEQAGIEEKRLDDIFSPVSFDAISLQAEKDEASQQRTEEEKSQTRGIIYVLLFVLYMAVIIYGQMIATDVATEKSSRVMEILISSAPPVMHMFAKITGVALLGLTQMIIFLITGYSLLQSKKEELVGGFFEVFGIQDTSISIYFYALLFFLLGYLLYATLAAMLGSLVSRVEDVQQLMMPMVFLILIAFFIAIFGLSVPESTFITVSSYIPFFTPMVMFLRVGMLNIASWEIMLTVGLLIGTIILLGILGARIYKGGVLMYGRSNVFKSIKEAVLLSRKE